MPYATELERSVSRASAVGLATFERAGATTVKITRACRVCWIARVAGGWLMYAERVGGFRYAVRTFALIDDAIHFATHTDLRAAA